MKHLQTHISTYLHRKPCTQKVKKNKVIYTLLLYKCRHFILYGIERLLYKSM